MQLAMAGSVEADDDDGRAGMGSEGATMANGGISFDAPAAGHRSTHEKGRGLRKHGNPLDTLGGTAKAYSGAPPRCR